MKRELNEAQPVLTALLAATALAGAHYAWAGQVSGGCVAIPTYR